MLLLPAVLFAIALLCLSVDADYYLVKNQTCSELNQGSEFFFDSFLLKCPDYRVDKVQQLCLTKEQEVSSLKRVPKWTLHEDATNGDSITRSFTFDDFKTAFYFMSQSAQLAEKNNHHPDWSNLYNVVDVKLTTDDQFCLGTFDIELAQGMDYLYESITKL